RALGAAFGFVISALLADIASLSMGDGFWGQGHTTREETAMNTANSNRADTPHWGASRPQ
ncbi:hypothetical protein, partial [Sphaerotilus sulfidivorans]|uniref:hypothetical protein n=1 Tax=Sphaerotilus sulfidivorans TaxID=639200 RepID=UPI003399D521